MKKLSYIDLMNNFWLFYDTNKDKIATSEIVLYFSLLRYCNKLNWINPFSINPFLMQEICPLAQNTYYKSLKILDSLKLIKWQKGRNNVSNQIITILKIEVCIESRIDVCIKYSGEDSTEDSIGNNNKTNIQIDEKTIKQLDKKDFDFLINSNEFKNYLKNENLLIEKAIAIPNDNVDYLYSIYPNNCFVKNTSNGKSLKNKDKIKTLLKNYGYEKLKSIFETYINDCKKNKTYMKNFATFLNNIPDYDSMTFEQPKILVKKLYVKYNHFYNIPKNKCFGTMEKWNEFYKNEDGINQIENFSFEWKEEAE